jgi:pimeloyl-ACP methyl ester carboxylesterase
MRRLWRGLAISLIVVLALLLVGPFLIPIPTLQGTVPPERLADADSHFADVDGLRLHYKIMGDGEPAVVLLHGFGASVFSWREVMAPLSALGTVVAVDRPGSGLTSRPLPGQWTGDSPYSVDSQVEQTVGLMDALGLDRAVLVGNSAGGTVAVLTALRHPDRVRALVLVDAAIYTTGGTPAWMRLVMHTPQMSRIGPLLVRNIRSWGVRLLHTAWHDPSRITPEILAGYEVPLRAENWDRGLWELTLASHPLDLVDQLDEIRVPVLVVTGDDDRIVPTEESIRLARDLAGAKLVVFPACGHTPQEECPAAFLEAVTTFIAGLP